MTSHQLSKPETRRWDGKCDNHPRPIAITAGRLKKISGCRPEKQQHHPAARDPRAVPVRRRFWKGPRPGMPPVVQQAASPTPVVPIIRAADVRRVKHSAPLTTPLCPPRFPLHPVIHAGVNFSRTKNNLQKVDWAIFVSVFTLYPNKYNTSRRRHATSLPTIKAHRGILTYRGTLP